LIPLHARDIWVFDLDNTLYPANHTIFDTIGDRMTTYIARHLGVPAEQALTLREQYHDAYGATVIGLVQHHGLDAADFLNDVHDTFLGDVAADPELAVLIAALPGRRIVFTNGARDYAHRIIAQLGLAGVFERIVALEDVGLIPKPELEAFERFVALCDVDPRRAVMIEDHARNLQAPASMGFATVLVGAQTPPAPYVHTATPDLHGFLRTLIPPRIDHAAVSP